MIVKKETQKFCDRKVRQEKKKKKKKWTCNLSVAIKQGIKEASNFWFQNIWSENNS